MLTTATLYAAAGIGTVAAIIDNPNATKAPRGWKAWSRADAVTAAKTIAIWPMVAYVAVSEWQ